MEVKTGDLIQNRYIIKVIMLDPNKDFKKPIFILFDKEKDTYIDFSEEQMINILNIKESEK